MKRIIIGVAVLCFLTLGMGCGCRTGDEEKPIAMAPVPAEVVPAPAVPEGMVLVEGGIFDMGSDQSEDGKPVHKVTVKSFLIGKYEVTFAEYDAYCQTTGKGRRRAESWWKLNSRHGIGPSDDQNWGRGNRPVINVTWYDTVAYCNWRSQKEGLTACYSINGTNVTYNSGANGYRLPTEAEWEYAARGGNKSRGYTYSGSNDAREVAWYSGNSGSKTQPVGGKKANELGIFDMSGNVWEWCWDWHGDKYYSQSACENPTGPTSGQSRVLRGGCWNGLDDFLGCAYRGDGLPAFALNIGGFRLARTSF